MIMIKHLQINQISVSGVDTPLNKPYQTKPNDEHSY